LTETARDPGPPPVPSLGPDAGRPGPSARTGLVGLAGAAALLQGLIQAEAFTSNPNVLRPSSDARVVWERAGEIASGAFVADMPFDTAPLPLWVAAAVRAVGGSVVALGVLQSLLFVAAVVLVAEVGRALVARVVEGATERDAWAAGLVAGALFMLTEDAAAVTSRVLGGSLQLVLGALWLALALRVSASAAAGRARLAAFGAVTGLLALAFPPALALVPVAMWAARGARLAGALTVAAAAALAISPATLHNWRASGELVPISSQAGLTFYHGNNPSADGRIAPVDVVNSKDEQARDSLARAREVLGPDAGWSDASRHWLGRGLDWWAEAPADAFGVALTKLWYALSARNYGDVVQARRERDDGTAARLWLAPVPVAWLLFPALAAAGALAFGCRRRLARAVPVLALGTIPVLVCVVFFYTPRYRLPAVPALAVLAAVALVRARVGGPRAAALVGVAAALGLASGPLNRAIGFDDDPGGAFARLYAEQMAQASGQLGWHERGAAYLAALLEDEPDDVDLRARLATLHWLLLGDAAEAQRILEAAPPGARTSRELIAARARLLATAEDPGVADGEAALALVEELARRQGGVDPGLMELRAAALARAGRFPEAAAEMERAIEQLPADSPARDAWRGLAARYSANEPLIRRVPE